MTPLHLAVAFLAVHAQAGAPATKLPKAQYRFRMLHAGKQVGTASYERTTTADERRTVLTIDESDNGVTLNAVIDTLSKRDGSPEKKSFHGIVADRTFSETAVFETDGVHFSAASGNNPEQSVLIKVPANGVVSDASESWFDKVTPKKGDSVTFTNFNVQAHQWEQTTTTFVGDEETKIGAKSYATHHIHVKSDQGEIDMFLDDNGDIVVMDQLNAIRLERAD